MKLRSFIGAFLIAIVACVGYSAHTAQALTVSPPRLEIAGDPGTTVRGEVVLYNEQSDAKTFYLTVENFEAQGETGAPSFVSGTNGLATWINTESQIVLAGGATKTVPFNITIPSNARPGGHFAAIFWGTNPPAGTQQVSVGARVGVLVLLRVAGDITENGGVSEFDAQGETNFFSAKQLSLDYHFQNAGDDRLLPEGTVTIKNMFGMKVAELNANESMGNVLPGSARKFTVDWNGGTPAEKLSFVDEFKRELKYFGFGWYKATLAVSYGVNNTTENVSTSFFVASWYVILLALIVLLIIFVGGRSMMRKHDKWLIKQAQRYGIKNPVPGSGNNR